MKRTEKAKMIESLREKFQEAKAVVLADYRGLTVERMTTLRERLRGGGVEFRVVKNTLAQRAVQGSGLEGLAPHFEGPTAVALGFEDPVAPARMLAESGKEWEHLRMKAGLVEGRLLALGELQAVAGLPGLDVLRGRLIGLIQAPSVKALSLLSTPGAQVARVLAARSEEAS